MVLDYILRDLNGVADTFASFGRRNPGVTSYHKKIDIPCWLMEAVLEARISFDGVVLLFCFVFLSFIVLCYSYSFAVKIKVCMVQDCAMTCNYMCVSSENKKLFYIFFRKTGCFIVLAVFINGYTCWIIG